MALEVAAFRIIGKTFGSALRETTTVIAVFLAAMSFGYWAGGRVGDRWPRGSTLALTLILAAVSMLFVPQIDALLSPRIAESKLALATHAFLASSILFAIPTVLLSATSPIAVRLFTTSAGHSGATAGSISAISTFGSIVGSVVTAFLLIDWLESITRTVMFVAAATSVTALLVIFSRWRNSMRGDRLVAAVATIILVYSSSMLVGSRALDSSLLAAGDGVKIVFTGDSAYHRIVVRDRGPFRDLKFNLGVQTLMRRSDPFGAGLAYTDAFHIAPLYRPEIRRVLLIGLGGGTAAKQFSRMYPGTIVDVVEVDQRVVDVAARYFMVQPNDGLRIHVQDGRTFLARSTEQWDLIVIDAYTTNRYADTIPAHLTTREFFEIVSARLTPGGIAHFHCAWSRSGLFDAIHATMSRTFASVLHTDGEILASNVPLIADRDVLLRRAKEGPAAHLPNLAAAISGLRKRSPGNGLVLTDDYAPVDTLLAGRPPLELPRNGAS